MTGRDLMRKSPNLIIVLALCATVMAMFVLGSYVFLSYSGKDAAEVSRFVNTILNFIMVIIGGAGAISAGAAAKNADEARNAAEETAKRVDEHNNTV